MDTKQWLSRWVKPTTAATTQRKHEKSSGAQVSHTDPIRGLPVVPNTHYVTRKVFSFMVWHLNDSVESLWRLELKPEWSPFKAHADLDHFKLTTSCQGAEQTQGAFTAKLTKQPRSIHQPCSQSPPLFLRLSQQWWNMSFVKANYFPDHKNELKVKHEYRRKSEHFP